jgi:hypothetical protein
MSNKITMIDPGSFSVWKSGVEEIDVRQYGDYLVRHRHQYHHCANLDIIPGEPNFPPSSEEAEAAVEKSWENYHYLDSLGLPLIPIYHQGEDDAALERIIDARCDYVGISPDDSASEPEREKFLDDTFYMITDSNGLPIVKTHGFGVTSVRLMSRYPWYSLDSTTWKKMAQYGGIMIPCDGGDGSMDYTRDPIKLSISEKSSKQFCVGGGIFLNNDAAMGWLCEFLEAEGFTIEEIESATTGYAARCRLNVRIMQRIAQELPVNPYRGTSFFLEKFQSEGGLQLGPRNLIFATEPCRGENELLTSERVNSRLLSYDKLRKLKDDYLDRYLFSW